MIVTTVIIWFYFRDAANCLIDWVIELSERKMAKSEVQRCLDWLFQQQSELEGSHHGQGAAGAQEEKLRLRSRQTDLQNFRKQVDACLSKYAEDAPEALELLERFQAVKDVAGKKTACLEVISHIAALEELVSGLAHEFDTRSVHLVNLSRKKPDDDEVAKTQTNESLARTSQNCIASVRRSWRWVQTTMKCAEVHLQNAALYQEFFHEVEEAEYWMNTTLSRIHLSFDRSKLQGDARDVKAIMEEIKDVLMAYLQWQTKVDSLFERSKEVVPVPQRLSKVAQPRPVTALCDYRTNEIEFIEGEALTLLDNSKKEKWLVQNAKGQSAQVPSVVILIPGPCAEAVDAALRLRLQLLSLWTTSVKRLGYQMIAFMLILFRDWSEDESSQAEREKKIAILQSLTDEDRAELLRVLQVLESSLVTHWGGYPDFQELQERILRLRVILEEAPKGGKGTNDEFHSRVVVQIKMLEQLLGKYQDFWAYWETFKKIQELLRQPKYLLVCDKWDQLRYITTAHFVRFWDTHLELDDVSKMSSKRAKPIKDNMLQAESSALTLHETPKEPMPAGSEGQISEEHQETITDEVETAEEEQRHTFVITGVLDPRDKHEMTLQHAIMRGIIDQANGLYINPNTRKAIPMSEAMNQGLIKMDIVSTEKIREEKKSFGLITIRTTKETRPYTIRAVLDPKTEEELSVAEAQSRGVLSGSGSTYHTGEGEDLSIADAIASGLVVVDYHDGGSGAKHPVTESRTYAINAVVDVKRKTKVNFHEAIRYELLDKTTGEFINSDTKDRLPIQQAIMKGFVKARVVADPSKIDIDPENTIVIQKFAHAKETLMRGLKTVKAFQDGVKH